MPQFETENNPGAGRILGSRNFRTVQWEEFADWFYHKGMRRLRDELDKLEGEKLIKYSLAIMEFFQPKTTNKNNFTPIQINVFNDSQAKKILSLQNEDSQAITGEVLNLPDVSTDQGSNPGEN